MITIEYHDCVTQELERYLKLLRPETTTVYELKYNLFYSTGLNPSMQRIFFHPAATAASGVTVSTAGSAGVIILDDDVKLLSAYGVREGHVLQLMEKVSPEFQRLQEQILENVGGGASSRGGTGRHSEPLAPPGALEVYDGIEVAVPEPPEVFLNRVREERAAAATAALAAAADEKKPTDATDAKKQEAQ